MIKLVKFFLRLLLRLLYRLEVTGLENYGKAGNRVLIVVNHASLLDGILIYALLPETPTFAINTKIAQNKYFKVLLRFAELFEMDPLNPLSIKAMVKCIRQNHKAVIFPEGRVTVTGTLMKVYEGPGMIAYKSQATILPIAIDGAQYSRLSYMRGRGYVSWFPKIRVHILPPEQIPLAANLTGQECRKQAGLKMYDIMCRIFYTCTNQDQTLFASLLASRQRFGGKTAVLEDMSREKLSVNALILRSLVLGELLEKRTLANEHVGVLLPNVNALPVVFFALQYIGRIPAMLNYTSDSLTLKRCCNTAGIKTILTSSYFINRAKLEGVAAELEPEFKLVYIDDLIQEVGLPQKLYALYKALSPARHYLKQPIDTNPDAQAVILFTSGSEGYPKGVVLSHRNLLSNFAQIRCHIHFNNTDTVFTCLPMFHAFGLNAGFLMPIFGGSKIFLYPNPLHYRIIPELIYETRATIFYATNTFLKNYAKHAHPYDFDSLQFVVAGAEKLHKDTMHVWMHKFGQRILQGYGVTETSPVISVNNKMQNKSDTIGRLISGMEYYIKPVEGMENSGHLVVKGPNVMLGYLLHDSPGVLRPPATERGNGWHDTGDIAAVDKDGFFTLLGRAKRFAKVGGEMVSLTAVEALASLTWPDVSHAAISVDDEHKGERIVMFTEYKQAQRKALQETARENHISKMTIPREVHVIDKIPVLNTGKTDYISLKNIFTGAETKNT